MKNKGTSNKKPWSNPKN